jgi:hypothetical protein
MEDLVDTGFSAVIANPAAVWRAPEEKPTPGANSSLPSGESEPPVTALTSGAGPVTATVKATPVPLPKELTVHMLARMAREIAQNIREPNVILVDYKLTQAQFDYLFESHEFFKQALHHAIIEWNAAGNTQDRIKLQAAAGFEDKLPLLLTRMGNASEGLPGVVEAAKLIAKVAGVGERDATASAPGERFTITINLGADEKLVVGHKDVSPAPAAPEETPRPTRLNSAPEPDVAFRLITQDAMPNV